MRVVSREFLLFGTFHFIFWFVLSGCASTMAKIIPVGEPVTKESCSKLDVEALGFRDGEEARRKGERSDFWKQDCGAFGVALDRAVYEKGYLSGMSRYCSCEKGFASGRKDEVRGLLGQYYVCGPEEYGEFIRGFDAGQVALAQEKNQTIPETDITTQSTLVCLKK